MRQKLRSSDKAFAREYLRIFLSKIEVDDEEVRIYGSKEILAAAAERTKELAQAEVLSFVPGWLGERDSNPHRQGQNLLSYH